VFSHKLCWRPREGEGFATDGGFPFQMRAIAGLFDSTTLVLPCQPSPGHRGDARLSGHNLTVVPLSVPQGQGLWHKMRFPFWFLRNLPVLIRETLRADAVHAPIPGDIGTIGMALALVCRKPLFVRHCGNWFVQATPAEHVWKASMQWLAGGANVMLATGGGGKPPSDRNPAVKWIFSSACTARDLHEAASRAGTREPGTRLIIGCRQDREKGTGIAIESLSRLVRDFPAITLDVVGDGEALAEFRQLAIRLGVDRRVTFHGSVPHDRVMALLQQADLFCYPTIASEGFPKIVLEALACGLPVVTTRVSVLPGLIGTGCGVLVDRAAPDEIAAAVKSCLMSPESYRRMSRCATATAAQYSLERWSEAIGEMLRTAWGPLRRNAGVRVLDREHMAKA
jgi:hypothetical protein